MVVYDDLWWFMGGLWWSMVYGALYDGLWSMMVYGGLWWSMGWSMG